jgi:diguanylate cyclase (GGDEF)-like protein
MDARGKTQICRSPVVSPEPSLPEQESRPLLRYLIVVRGGIPGTMLPLVQSASSLGRSAENTFPLADGTVSRWHAVISIDPAGEAWVTDLGSSNGTYLDGKRIPVHAPFSVKDGSRIQIGASTLLKYLKLDPCEEGFQREMYERAVRDALTGLYNRSYFLSQVGPLAELNALCELGLAIILVDLDHFKRINDHHGHPVGDRVLKEVAEVLRESTRPEDLVARYGGEEFIVALPTSSLDQAFERAERIRSQLATRDMRACAKGLRVTASLGLSYAPPARIHHVAALITLADEALYEAKRNGRNRVAASRGPLEPGGVKTESAEALEVI